MSILLTFTVLSDCCCLLYRVKGKGGKGKKGSGAVGGDVQFKKTTVRYTGQKLHEKGVILEVEGLPQHQ